MPWGPTQVQKEEERLLLFPGKDSANKKSRTLCLVWPSQLPFLLYRSVLPPLWREGGGCEGGEQVVLASGLPSLQTPNCNSLLIWTHLCWRDIWESIYFRSTLTLAYSGQNHLTQSLFYNKIMNISCNVLNTVLRVKNRMVLWVQNGGKYISFLPSILPSNMRKYCTTYDWPGERSKFTIWSMVSTECV